MLLADAAGTGLFTHDCGRDGPRYLVIPPSKVRTLWELCDAAFVTTWSEVAEGTFFRGL